MVAVEAACSHSIRIMGFPHTHTQFTIIDFYGEFGIDGTDTEAEFKDGRAARLLVTGPSAVWNVSEWDIVTGETGTEKRKRVKTNSNSEGRRT